MINTGHFQNITDRDSRIVTHSTRLVRGCFGDGNVETFEFSLTSLFACQGRFRDSDTSLSDDEDSTPKTLQLGEKGSIGRFWKDCGRQFYMLYLILRI